jgi:hypothetical protein
MLAVPYRIDIMKAAHTQGICLRPVGLMMSLSLAIVGGINTHAYMMSRSIPFRISISHGITGPCAGTAQAF